MLSWPEALTIVGSVATLALTVLQLVGRKSKNDKTAQEDTNAVTESEIANLYERIDRMENSIEKIQDLFIQLLRDERD